ncbi:MAG: hypothetical protein WCT50_02530 [Patescibacteria group bacterium]
MQELSLEQQEKLERLKLHLVFFQNCLLQKANLVPAIASLSAMVLVVASFNPDLLKITTNIKVILSVLLFLIPASLLFSIFDYDSAINESKKAMEEMVGKIDLPKKNFLWRYFTYIISFVLLGVIIDIIICLWRGEIIKYLY